MADFLDFVDLLGRLRKVATPRPDLGETKPVSTFAGRVVRGDEDIADVMARFPSAELETGSTAIEAPALLASLGPVRTAIQKKIVKAIHRASPELLEDVVKAPGLLQVGQGTLGEVSPKHSLQSASGFFIPEGPRGGRLYVDPSVMRGKEPETLLEKAFRRAVPEKVAPQRTGQLTGAGNLPLTAAHEAQHFVNKDQLMRQVFGPYEELAKGATEIIDFIDPQGAKVVKNLMAAGENVAAADEAMAYLREAVVRNPEHPLIKQLADKFLKVQRGASQAVKGSTRLKAKQPVLYHGSTARKKIIPDPKRAIETKGAAFLSDNPDVADTFTVPREYGEPVFYDFAGKEIKPGRVTKLKADIKNPKILKGEEAQKFIDDTSLQGRIIEEAKEAGHDSVIAQDVLEGIGDRFRSNVYAIFNKDAMRFSR